MPCFSRAVAHDSAVSTAQHPLRCADRKAKSNSNFTICAKAYHGNTSAHHLTAAEAFAHALKQHTAQQLLRCKDHSANNKEQQQLPFYMGDC